MSEPTLYTVEMRERPFPGLTREWYQGSSLVAYQVTEMSLSLVDAWARTVLETLQSWDRSKPYLAVHDLSHPGVSLQYAALVNFDVMNIGVTPDGRIDAELLFDQHPEWRAKVALNFNMSLSGQTNRTLMNFLSQVNPAIQYKSFYNRNKAMRWLLGDAKDTSEVAKTATSEMAKSLGAELPNPPSDEAPATPSDEAPKPPSGE